MKHRKENLIKMIIPQWKLSMRKPRHLKLTMFHCGPMFFVTAFFFGEDAWSPYLTLDTPFVRSPFELIWISPFTPPTESTLTWAAARNHPLCCRRPSYLPKRSRLPHLHPLLSSLQIVSKLNELLRQNIRFRSSLILIGKSIFPLTKYRWNYHKWGTGLIMAYHYLGLLAQSTLQIVENILPSAGNSSNSSSSSKSPKSGFFSFAVSAILKRVWIRGTWSYSLWLIQYSWKWPRNETGYLRLQSSTCWGLSQILWKNWRDNFWTESIIAHKYLLLCGEIKLYYCINLTSNQNKWWVISTSTCNSVSTLIQNFVNLLSLSNSCHGDEKNFSRVCEESTTRCSTY